MNSVAGGGGGVGRNRLSQPYSQPPICTQNCDPTTDTGALAFVDTLYQYVSR